ncbi:MAG: 1-acyl-sn-glycerol-3-phosphate acyltransferase [Bacteroidales bacterium]|nr:1-acyl-sn-glycerol-3-phosphate acyltransferase [Bacteroidales bacterium]
MKDNFDDIRPYNDDELPEAMRRIADWDLFPQVIRFIYPNADIAKEREKLLSIRSVHQFQSTLMNDAIRRIIATTTSGFTHSGLQHLRRGVPYLFIANHRDITLDAFLLQHLLLEHRDETSHIVFGNNLLSMPVMEDLFRSNKLIPMARGGSPRAFYDSLLHLSLYLSDLVTVQHQSAWIAQNNGRAKDGHDVTAPALIKMLTLSRPDDPLQALADLHLVPLTISYEWDPCDLMKATELYCRRHGDYQKKPHEDLKSVVTGIIGHKGKVHLAIGAPLSCRELTPPAGMQLFEHVATVLDRHIQGNYRLMPTNYVAHSLLTGIEQHGRYTELTRSQFLQRLEALPEPEMRQIMIETYAAPVTVSRRQANQKSALQN